MPLKLESMSLDLKLSSQNITRMWKVIIMRQLLHGVLALAITQIV